jgi:hypothetical protein
MNLAKVAAQAAITGALGFGALGLGVGAGTASADPGPGACGAPFCNSPGNDGRGDRDRGNGNDFRPQQWDQRDRDPQWGPQQWDQRDWNQRGIDDGRFDHQPFNWQGQRVEPYFDNDRSAWGFWFLGAWIPL